MTQDIYCILIITRQILPRKFVIAIDLGQHNLSTTYPDALKDYTSEVDSINYMSSQGWDLVSSYCNQNLLETRHMLRKRTTL